MNLETWLSGNAERVVETHCARIFLRQDTAWKLKKPVDLGFLDFTTLEKRRWALERELVFNAPAAPGIYRAVHAITEAADGFAFGGEGTVVEYALEMRRFDETAVLDVSPDALTGEVAEALGRAVARLHAQAPESEAGAGAAVAYTVTSNAEHLRALAPELGEAAVARLLADTEAALAKAAPLLATRAGPGMVRRCHGDLHLGNILMENGAPVLFDCIEFSDLLSDIDVLYDLAFLLMDLDFRGRRAAAVRVLSAWLDEAARTFDETALYEGLALLPLMMSIRAAVRCHVCAGAGHIEDARAYLAAAQRHLSPGAPALAAVGGYSGAGKSTFARALAPLMEPAPGAVILRSDEIRKRLWGAAPAERLPKEAYAAGESARVYSRMFEAAAACLRAGRSVVMDAVFLRPEERAAAGFGAPFTGVWLEAPEEVLRARIAGRENDASDADLAVLAEQMARGPGAISWARMDAERGFDEAAQALVSGLAD